MISSVAMGILLGCIENEKHGQKESQEKESKTKKNTETDAMEDDSNEEIQFVYKEPEDDKQSYEIKINQEELNDRSYKRDNEIFNEPLTNGFCHIKTKLASNLYLKAKKKILEKNEN